jgi:hypothetical protein
VTELEAEQAPQTDAAPPRPTLAQRVVAFVFLGAFATSILTVVLTGLWVRGPGGQRAVVPVAVTLQVGEPRTVDLPLESRGWAGGAELVVGLPAGVEVRGYAGQRRVAQTVRIEPGAAGVPLDLVAVDGRGGTVAAQLRRASSETAYVVRVTVEPR